NQRWLAEQGIKLSAKLLGRPSRSAVAHRLRPARPQSHRREVWTSQDCLWHGPSPSKAKGGSRIMDCKYSPGAKPPPFEEASTATRSNHFSGIIQMDRGIK